jgi:hypothetical protein
VQPGYIITLRSEHIEGDRRLSTLCGKEKPRAREWRGLSSQPNLRRARRFKEQFLLASGLAAATPVSTLPRVDASTSPLV